MLNTPSDGTFTARPHSPTFPLCARGAELFKFRPAIEMTRVVRKAGVGEANARVGGVYPIERRTGGRSRTEVRWGPRFSSTAPAQDPPLLLPQIFPWGQPPGLPDWRRRSRECSADFHPWDRRLSLRAECSPPA